MKVEGRCHCGQITYEATVDPEKVSICHCTDCQMLTGSAYRATVPDTLHLAADSVRCFNSAVTAPRGRAYGAAANSSSI